MTPTPPPDVLAEQLPGRWTLRATNFPMWIRGDRRHPVFEYGLVTAQPLVLTDRVEYVDERRGPRAIPGRDRLRGEGEHAHFVWRGAGTLGLLSSRWVVSGLDGDVLAIRFERSLVTPAGVDLLSREGVELPELRRRAAEDLDRLGLAVEEFAALTWLPEH
jgi:hypothetical protein